MRQWRDAVDGFVIVVNSTYELCPWADALYAMDNEWWRQSGASKKFSGAKFSRYGEYGTQKSPSWHGKNSGAGAILLADKLGFDDIVLLGYDCQRTYGLTHWHGNHERPLGNCESMPHWQQYFADTADLLRARVVNCSRETALESFPRGILEDELYTAIRGEGLSKRHSHCG